MFVQIPEFPMYLVDETGVIISMTHGKWRVLKQHNPPNRYPVVSVCKEGKTISKTVHRLVMAAWKGSSGLWVNHKNGIKTDNRLENLEYCTPSENRVHAYATGLQEKTFAAVSKVGKAHCGENHALSKLTEGNVLDILGMKGELTAVAVAKKFNVSPSYIGQLWRGTSWKHLKEKSGGLS